MFGFVLYFNKNIDKLWTLVSALWCFKVVPCTLIFFLFGNATRIGRYGKIRRSDRTATMVVGVLGAEGSGLSAMRSVDIFSQILLAAVVGGWRGGLGEVTGSRRVWLAAVGFCRHAECWEDSDNIITIILYAYCDRARCAYGRKRYGWKTGRNNNNKMNKTKYE